MAHASIVPPAGYRIASGPRPDAPDMLAWYILRQDDRDVSCWREIAGPYVQRGGATQRLDRIIARQLIPPRRRVRAAVDPGTPDRDMTDRDMTDRDMTDRDMTDRDMTGVI